MIVLFHHSSFFLYNDIFRSDMVSIICNKRLVMYMHNSLGHSFSPTNVTHFCSLATVQHCFVTFAQLNANFNENC